MVICGTYHAPSGANLGPLVRRFLAKHEVDEKAIFLGRMDQGHWSRMMRGEDKLDLNFLYAYMPTDVFLSLMVSVIAEKTRQLAGLSEIEGVA